MSQTFDDQTWQRLHELRLRRMTQVADDPMVAALAAAGYVLRRGAFVAVTPAGKEAGSAWARLDAHSEEYESFRQAYERFLAFDAQVKSLTTDWQLAGANTGSATYSSEEWHLVDRLRAFDEKAGPVVSQLGRAVGRFAGYRPRLRKALEQLEAGDREWFSGARCDSYHTVWWHLHEDLLLALGMNRSDDPPP
jgi:hypothetical protein